LAIGNVPVKNQEDPRRTGQNEQKRPKERAKNNSIDKVHMDRAVLKRKENSIN
jgi:hypothetical protein